MKEFAIVFVCLLTGCATQHRESPQVLRNLYIDCTNKQSFENYYMKQLQMTDVAKSGENFAESKYYSAIKDRLWTLRSACP